MNRLQVVVSSTMIVSACVLATSGVALEAAGCDPTNNGSTSSTSSSGGACSTDADCPSICEGSYFKTFGCDTACVQVSSTDCAAKGQVCDPKAGCVPAATPPPPPPPPPPADAGADASVALDCNSYCTAMQARCTGAQAQYTTLATCLGFCAKLPVGALSDTSGNTLGCRVGHAVSSLASPADECAKAGPSGGDTTPGGSPGACGDICDSFCAVGTVVCPGETSECAAMLCTSYNPAPASYSTALTSGNDIGCRLYQLTLASEDADAGATRCADIGAGSTVCQ
jgi:hypothetical protein